MTPDNPDLRKTVCDLRAQKYQDLPEELVLAILQIETDAGEDRNDAIKQIGVVLDQHVPKKAK